MSSKIFLLATSYDVCFNYIIKYKDIYNRIWEIIDSSGMRLDFHLDQFCVINSIKKEIVLGF